MLVLLFAFDWKGKGIAIAIANLQTMSDTSKIHRHWESHAPLVSWEEKHIEFIEFHSMRKLENFSQSSGEWERIT